MVSSISSTYNTGITDFLERQKELFKKADTDGDGKLSLSEFEAAKPSNLPADAPAASDVFSQLDTNQDGFVDSSEAEAGMSQMGPPPGGMPPPPPPSQSQGLSDQNLSTILDMLAQESQSSDNTDSTAASDSSTASGNVDYTDNEVESMIRQAIQEFRAASAAYRDTQDWSPVNGNSTDSVTS